MNKIVYNSIKFLVIHLGTPHVQIVHFSNHAAKKYFNKLYEILKMRRPPVTTKNAPLSWPVFKIAMPIVDSTRTFSFK